MDMVAGGEDVAAAAADLVDRSVAPVRKTRSFQTTGELLPSKGTAVFHKIFLPVGPSHDVGNFTLVATPMPDGPRNCGQFLFHSSWVGEEPDAATAWGDVFAAVPGTDAPAGVDLAATAALGSVAATAGVFL